MLDLRQLRRLVPQPRHPHAPSAETTDTSGGASAATGMIVFSASGRMLHMNAQARALMALFGEVHELWPNLGPESLPSIISEFCRDVFAQLRSTAGDTKWGREMQRVCHMVTPPLLLRGFGMPHSSAQEPRMVLTLQPASLNESTLTQLGRAVCHSDSILDRPREHS